MLTTRFRPAGFAFHPLPDLDASGLVYIDDEMFSKEFGNMTLYLASRCIIRKVTVTGC